MKQFKRYVIPLVILTVLISAFFAYDHLCSKLPEIPPPSNPKAQWGLPVIKLETPDGIKLAVEVAWTAQQKQHGLMYRDIVPPQTGMLFVHDKLQYHNIWMKNTSVSLDLVFLDENKKVTVVYSDIPPGVDIPDGKQKLWTGYGKYVLEVASGESKRLSIQKGTVLEFNLGRKR